MMKSEFRCSVAARAACEFRKVCGEEATFFEGSQCYDFNKEIENRVIVKTNADRIRAMNDEELKEFLCSVTDCSVCVWSGSSGCGLMEWLHQPVKEGK